MLKFGGFGRVEEAVHVSPNGPALLNGLLITCLSLPSTASAVLGGILTQTH